MKTICALCGLLFFCAQPALADDASDADPFADLFGDTPKTSNLDSLRKASEGVKKRTKKGVTLKEGAKLGVDKKVALQSVFAAAFIKMHKKRGCIPAGRHAKMLTGLSFDFLPSKSAPFSTCLHIASDAGRQMRMTVSIVGPRNNRVAKAETVINFSGKKEMDHILDFPAIVFPVPGKYVYWVEIDGKKVGTLPLFTVSLIPSP